MVRPISLLLEVRAENEIIPKLTAFKYKLEVFTDMRSSWSKDRSTFPQTSILQINLPTNRLQTNQVHNEPTNQLTSTVPVQKFWVDGYTIVFQETVLAHTRLYEVFSVVFVLMMNLFLCLHSSSLVKLYSYGVCPVIKHSWCQSLPLLSIFHVSDVI